MDRILSYALVVTIGLSSTTIAAAVVGNPIPVVVPSVAALLAVAGHHVRLSDDDAAHAHSDDTPAQPEGSA